MGYLYDLLVVAAFAFAIWRGYRGGMDPRLYAMAKIFIIVSVSGAYAISAGVWLTRKGILSVETMGMLMLIGFVSLLILCFAGAFLLEWGSKKWLGSLSQSSGRILGAVVNGLQVLLLVLFGTFFLMQFTLFQKGLSKPLAQSLSYPPTSHFFRKMVSRSFVEGAIFGNNTGTSTKELFLKTVTDDNFLKALKK